jgi:hypothetical protein
MFTTLRSCGPLVGAEWYATTRMREKMVHRIPDRTDEQSKEAKEAFLVEVQTIAAV